ncbi:metallophosphatase [Bacteroidales bacterium]|nr:metallophosphatase [Bacteroidales bacterium]
MYFFLRSIFSQFFINAFMMVRIWRSKMIPQYLKYFLILLYGAETTLYFVALFGAQRLPTTFLKFAQHLSGIWVFFNIYLLVLILLFDIFWWLKNNKNLFPKMRAKTGIYLQCLFITAFFVLLGTEVKISCDNYLTPSEISLTQEYNKKENSSNEPIATYKIVVASDFHLGYLIDKASLSKYVKQINAHKPDIIVLNGDLIDHSLRPLIQAKMNEELSLLHAPKGVYFIPGNHEYKFNHDIKFEWIRNSGIQVLRDSVANIDNKLLIVGRDDRSREEIEEAKGEEGDKRLPIADLMERVDLLMPVVFFAHQPGDIKEASEYNLPLVICGHTHQGQVFPVNIISKFLYKNDYGYKKIGETSTYTSSGIGFSGFPIRIGTDSEILILTIKIY